MNNWEDYNTALIDNLLFLLYNKIMETKTEQRVAECQDDIIVNSVQNENIIASPQEPNGINGKSKTSIGANKKPLTPYQKYKNNRNQNGKKYFEFYDDVKVYTHNIWDW